MNETIQWEPYRPPHNRPEEFTARGTPWTRPKSAPRKSDEYGPLPDLKALKRAEETKCGRGFKLPITDERRKELARERARLGMRLKSHPEQEKSIRDRLAALKEANQAQALAELRSGATAAALNETGVRE